MRKFCFKCNREHNEQDMVPKYNKWGKKIGTECRLCAKRQSHSFMAVPPKPENQKPIVIE